MTINLAPSTDFYLGDTADAIRDRTARFATIEIAPWAAEIDRSNALPPHLKQARGTPERGRCQ